jgi:D-sedoheptulose 7-phosphate isomerase
LVIISRREALRYGEVRGMGLNEELEAHVSALTSTVAETTDVVSAITERLCSCFRDGGSVMLCGNGGSAADAQHIAAEFVNRLHVDRPALPAVALTTDSSILTCVANDSSYDQVFARQVHALGRPGDTLVALSTSGASPSVIAALAAGREHRLVTVGFTGRSGRAHMQELCDHLLVASSDDCARIQECHGFLWHVIVGMVEQEIFGSSCS